MNIEIHTLAFLLSLTIFIQFIVLLFAYYKNRRLNAENIEAIENLELIFNTIPDAILIINFETGSFVQINDGFSTMTGFTRGDVIGQSSLSINLWDNPDERLIFLSELKKGFIDNLEFILRRKDGSNVVVSMSAKILQIDGKPHVVSIIHDISKREEAKSALQKDHSRLELGMTVAGMAWWEMDIVTGNVIFNKRKTDILGYKYEDFKHYNDFMQLVHPEDADKAMDIMRKHFKGEVDKYETDYRILTASGEYRWFYDIGSIQKRDAAGRPLLVTGLVIDVTQRKRAEIEILEIKEKLEKINSEKDKFFSIIAHDLRSPFTGFLGLTQMIAEDAGNLSVEELEKLGYGMHQTANNLFNLLKNLLEWSQMQRGSMGFEQKEISLSNLIADNINTLKGRSEQKGIKE